MITLPWIESELEKALQERPTAQAVYDLSALITVRAYLLSRSDAEKEQPQEVKAPAINFLDYCADLDKCPTIEQVEIALGSVAVNSREDAKRVKDAHTWADILRR